MKLSITNICHYAECRYDDCCDLFVVMLKVLMLNVIMLNVVMSSVIMLSVVAPTPHPLPYNRAPMRETFFVRSPCFSLPVLCNVCGMQSPLRGLACKY